jgi:hypothetical protein
MSTAEIAIAALAAAIGTAGAVTSLGTSKPTGGTGPVLAFGSTGRTGPAFVVGPTGGTGAPAPMFGGFQFDSLMSPTGPTALSFTFGSPTGPAPIGPTGLPFTLGASRPNFAIFKDAADELEKKELGGRRRVSTLRRKPKTRSKNGRRSPHKSASRGDR